MSKKNTISFCMISMNRLHQLKETLPENIKDNKDYTDLEFLLLDYNSSDGMEDWVKENMQDMIDSGKMVYYRTPTPTEFSHSHAKNMAFKLAKGNIVCNINADHFTGPGFADYINEAFNRNESIVLTPIDFHKVNKNHTPPTDILGKVCVKKSDFLQVKGFDERMKKYGYEDCDFINRLEILGLQRILIENKSFFRYISHKDEDRFTLSFDHISAIYIHSAPSLCHLLFLYKTGQFKKGILVDHFTVGSTNYLNAFMPKKFLFRFNLQEPGLTEGVWQEFDDHFELHGHSGSAFVLTKERSRETVKDVATHLNYALLNDARHIGSLVKFTYLYENQAIMENNLKQRQLACNGDEFGNGMVFKNFTQQPIFI